MRVLVDVAELGVVVAKVEVKREHPPTLAVRQNPLWSRDVAAASAGSWLSSGTTGGGHNAGRGTF